MRIIMRCEEDSLQQERLGRNLFPWPWCILWITNQLCLNNKNEKKSKHSFSWILQEKKNLFTHLADREWRKRLLELGLRKTSFESPLFIIPAISGCCSGSRNILGSRYRLVSPAHSHFRWKDRPKPKITHHRTIEIQSVISSHQLSSHFEIPKAQSFTHPPPPGAGNSGHTGSHHREFFASCLQTRIADCRRR